MTDISNPLSDWPGGDDDAVIDRLVFGGKKLTFPHPDRFTSATDAHLLETWIDRCTYQSADLDMNDAVVGWFGPAAAGTVFGAGVANLGTTSRLSPGATLLCAIFASALLLILFIRMWAYGHQRKLELVKVFYQARLRQLQSSEPSGLPSASASPPGPSCYDASDPSASGPSRDELAPGAASDRLGG